MKLNEVIDLMNMGDDFSIGNADFDDASSDDDNMEEAEPMAAGSDDEDIGVEVEMDDNDAEEDGMDLDFFQAEIEEHDTATASTGRCKTSYK